MSMNIRTLSLILTAAGVLAAAGAAGCAQSKEVGKSGKQLFRGEVGAVVQQSPAQVEQAVQAAIADLNLIRITATTRPSKEQTETVVIARTAKDAKVSIAYRGTDPAASSTRVVVTTGVMGNSELRDQVWDAVRIRLGVLNLTANTSAQYGPPAPQRHSTASIAE